ncbi:disease resistance protein Roq1-like [Gastrolobium bilobum]|uniref:disease resistance protein Roq1-like n=1 Tax=Gastrolobium bilobum TaxID=150636 RepID=UPI002AB1EDF8|nr:disease resistance protein Roq1-like [Gastrolobium bilobum]
MDLLTPSGYDVFLSFSGENSFTSTLCNSLLNAGATYFVDDDKEFQNRDQNSTSLPPAIRNSENYFIVFSRNYAGSRLCLQKLEVIMERQRTKLGKVVPVFYGVDSSEVSHQKGEFGEAFDKLLNRISPDEDQVLSWRTALRDASGIPGFVVEHSRYNGSESEDMDNVVEVITRLLDKASLFVTEHSAGVESRAEEVIRLLNSKKSEHSLLLGIWGIGGIGKTTVAKYIYKQIGRNFDTRSFIPKVRAVWEQNNGQISLQERPLSDIYEKIGKIEAETVILKEKLRQKKLLLVLDDVNKFDQLKALCGSREWFGPGSVIIITTRDEHLLLQLGVDHAHRMKEMDKNESLELFSWHAFNQASPAKRLEGLSNVIVEYSRGLPLVLQVLGSFLFCKGKNEWNSALENLVDESEDIRNIVERVTGLLDDTVLFVAEHPVGVESRVQDVIQLLNNQQTKHPLLLGMWGMGGVGKTTIAKAIYNEIGRNFQAKSFLLNVREVWEQNNGQVSLQQRLLSDIYKTTKLKIDTTESGKMELQKRLSQKRIFLVLDDVDKLDQLNALCGGREWFGGGSRIIITTRDEHLLSVLRVDRLYRMKEMKKSESLELFSWHAFKQASPREGFAHLSRDVVEYSGGLPLALQVLGSFLNSRGIRDWEIALEKLKIIPNHEILRKLKISFDGLSDDKVKEIFLDIAFFFIGKDRDDVIEILNDCGLFAEIGIRELAEKSLVTVNIKNRLGMHDLLRDMGREIVREKSPELAEERTRLWLQEDVLDVLSKDTGTIAVKGLTLMLPRMDTTTDLKTKAFEKMKRLRLLQLAGIQLDGDYKYLSQDLRWLCWDGFPSEYTPADFHQGSLVAIELKYSNMQQVWTKSKMLTKLKILNLSHSHNLRQTPDFSKIPNLKKLILKDCPRLSSVSDTIEHLKEILLINLKDCTGLSTLPRSIYKLKTLKILIISGCSKIDKLEEDLEQMENLTTLIADNTDINEVPFSIVRSKSIAFISLCGYRGSSRDVFPSLIWSWMSPTNSVLSQVQTYVGMSSLAFLDEQNSRFHGQSYTLKDLQKLQRLCVECDSKVQLHETVERILDTLNTTNYEELEAMPSTSHVSNIKTSALIDCHSQARISGSENSLTSLLIQMGMNCHVTNILRENILQKMSTVGPGFLPSDNYPDWLAFSGDGSSVILDVPQVLERNLKTIMCIVYFSSPENMTPEVLKNMLVINYTKNTIQLYKRDALTPFEDEEWQRVVSNIEPGNKVNVVLVFENRFIVNKTTVFLIYDELIDEKGEHCHTPDRNAIVSGGDENIENSGQPSTEAFPAVSGKEKPGEVCCYERTTTPTLLKINEEMTEMEKINANEAKHLNEKIEVIEAKHNEMAIVEKKFQLQRTMLNQKNLGQDVEALADLLSTTGDATGVPYNQEAHSEPRVHAEMYKAKSIEETSNALPNYSMAKCMNALNEIEDVSDEIYVKASEKFMNPDRREMFLTMPMNRRKAWLDRLQ